MSQMSRLNEGKSNTMVRITLMGLCQQTDIQIIKIRNGINCL